jgi:hypothetical protein
MRGLKETRKTEILKKTRKTGEVLKKPGKQARFKEVKKRLGAKIEPSTWAPPYSAGFVVVHPEWTGGWACLNQTKSRKQSWANANKEM